MSTRPGELQIAYTLGHAPGSKVTSESYMKYLKVVDDRMLDLLNKRQFGE